MGTVQIPGTPKFITGGTYSPKDDRWPFQEFITEGYVDSLWAAHGAMFVVSPGSGMNLNISAGNAFVKGKNVQDQGLYHVASSGTLTVSVTAAHATLPRIDQVVIRVFETTHDGSGNNFARIDVIDGTPTSGATLANRLGAANLAAIGTSVSTLLIADVLVPAASSSISSGNISDRRIKASLGAALDIRAISGELASEFNIDSLPLPAPKYGLGGFAVGQNRSGGSGEVNFWSLNPNSSFEFRMKTGVATDKLLGALDANSLLTLSQNTGGVQIVDVLLRRLAAQVLGTPNSLAANDSSSAAVRLFNYFSGRAAIGFGSSFQNVLIHQIPEQTIAQATQSMVFQLNTGRYAMFALLQSRKSADQNIASSVMLFGNFDTSQPPGVTKIFEITRAGGGADTFIALYNGAVPQVNVTTSATGSPGSTLWNGIVLAVGQQF